MSQINHLSKIPTSVFGNENQKRFQWPQENYLATSQGCFSKFLQNFNLYVNVTKKATKHQNFTLKGFLNPTNFHV